MEGVAFQLVSGVGEDLIDVLLRAEAVEPGQWGRLLRDQETPGVAYGSRGFPERSFWAGPVVAGWTARPVAPRSAKQHPFPCGVLPEGAGGTSGACPHQGLQVCPLTTGEAGRGRLQRPRGRQLAQSAGVTSTPGAAVLGSAGAALSRDTAGLVPSAGESQS